MFSDADLQGFFDSKEMLSSINELCSTKNAIKKSERKYFSYSHVANLLCFYVQCTTAKIGDLSDNLATFVSDTKDSLYFLGGFLSGIRRSTLTKPQVDRVQSLVEELTGKKVAVDSYRQATYLLALQNVCKTLKLRIDNSKFDALENQCAGLVSAKSLSKYFEEIVVDDNLNTSLRVPLFEEVVVNILHRSNEKAISKLFKFFHSAMDNIQKDKAQRQKKAFHLICFLRAFLENVDPQVLLSMDLEQSLSRANIGTENGEPSTIADIFVDLLTFWVKQFGNKNPESKKASAELDHTLAAKVKGVDRSTALQLTIFLLRILKFQPTNSLRGGDLKLMQTLLGYLYQDDASFNKYFSMLKDRIKSSSKISELNFYLNELEHLGQISLSAKHHKEMDSEREATLRCTVLKSLINVYLHCETEKDLHNYFGEGSKLDWNEQELSFRKFRTKIFERILNTVFKREDSLLLAKAAELYGGQVGSKDAEVQAFFKRVLESAKKINKSHQPLASLQRSLVFQNIFEDDISKNSDIVGDILTSCQLMEAGGETSKKRVKTGELQFTLESKDQMPEDVFVDSLIALCSTSYPQAKHVVNNSFEVCSDRISRVGFSLMCQAIAREDAQYLQDEDADDDGSQPGNEDDGEGLEEAELESGESEQEELDEEDAKLGKRQPKTNGKSNGIDKHIAVKQSKPKSKAEK